MQVHSYHSTYKEKGCGFPLDKILLLRMIPEIPTNKQLYKNQNLHTYTSSHLALDKYNSTLDINPRVNS